MYSSRVQATIHKGKEIYVKILTNLQNHKNGLQFRISKLKYNLNILYFEK